MRFQASSELEAEWALSTSGTPSSFNQNSLSSDGNTWNMMAYRAESRMTLGLDDSRANSLGLDSASIFVRPRFFSDIAPEVDGSLKHVNLFGGLDGGRYEGNGWMAQSVGTHEYIFDAMEAYADLDRAGWSLRIGKQRINWSPMLFVRVLDTVDSLDLRRHGMFDLIGDHFDEQRIGTWTAKLSYALPEGSSTIFTDTSAEAFISPDFEPWTYPAQGSTYSIFPSEALMEDSAQIARARNKLVYGAAGKTTVKGLELTLNFVSTPQNSGVLSLAEATGAGAVAGTPIKIDPVRGIASYQQLSLFDRALRAVPSFPTPVALYADWLIPPDLAENPFARGPFDLAITRIFPREDVYGGSASYRVKPDQFPGASLLQGLFHIEMTYTPHKQFDFQLFRYPRKHGELSIGLMYQGELEWLPTSPTLVLEYWYKSRSDFWDHLAGGYFERDLPFSAYSLEQSLFDWKLKIVNTVLLDLSRGAGLWYQPGVTFTPGHRWEYGAYWNFFTGGDRSMFGWLDSFDELVLKVACHF